MLDCLLWFFWGESSGCRLFSTASMLEWLSGAVRKDGAKISWGWSLPECFMSSGGLEYPPLFLIIQWRRQRHLTWSTTHDVVSREINLWKGFYLLRGPNLWLLAPNAGCLTARPPELTDWMSCLLVVRGVSPGCRLFGTA